MLTLKQILFRKKGRQFFLALALFFSAYLLLSQNPAYAANPTLINFQGKVVNADGTNVTNGSYNFDFILYDDPTLGTPGDGVRDRWHEMTKSVTVTNGVFQTSLGSACPLFTSNACNNSTPLDFNTLSSLHLAIRFNADAAGYMSPRAQMSSVPYAFNADRVGGLAASALGQLSSTQTWTGLNTFQPTTNNVSALAVRSQTSKNVLTVNTTAGSLILGDTTASGITGTLVFNTSNNANTVTIQGGATAATYALTLPTNAPALNDCLQNNGTTIGHLVFASCAAGGGDNISVNTTAATDTNFIDTAGSGTVAGTTWTLNTGATPDTIALTIGNASATEAGAVTNGPQTLAGDKTLTGLSVLSGGATLSGTILINNTGTANTTIGNTGGGTITVGAASGSDLALQDAQWSVSGTGVAAFVSVNAGSGSIQTTGNVLGNNFDRTTAGSISLGDINATSVSVCNTVACDTINIGTNTDADTINLGDTNDTVNLGGKITGAGLGSCTTANDKLTYNSSTQVFGCATLEVNSFVDSTSDAVVDANTTNYWDNATENGNQHPNISLSSTSNSVFGLVSTEVTASSNTDIEVSYRGERNIGSNPTCNSSTQVGGNGGIFSTNTNAVKSSTFSFMDSPATLTSVFYTLCSDAATVGTGANITRIRVSLFELTNAADLAEVYPTNDYTLTSAEVVALDPDLPNGVKRTTKAYDTSLFGIISTQPAMVIGGTDGIGKTGVAIALTGRVPVKVSTENGAIRKGDILTSSSTPGVAMKATKAGGMLGIAMSDFNGSGTGTVMIFLKTGDYNGSNLSDILESNDTNSVVTPDLNVTALNYFMSQNSANTVNELNLSEILTDRIVAGLEIISPKVTTDKLFTNSIEAATGKEVNIKLANDGKLLLSSASGDSIVSFTDKGDAKFKGGISTELDISAGGSLFAAGGLTISGNSNFRGETVFQKFVSFLDRTVFKHDVTFEGRATFNNDTAGFATIHSSQKQVEVKFDKPYNTPPVVIVNVKNGQFVNYAYKDLTEKGFTIVLKDEQTNDIEFSWTALAIYQPRTVEVPLQTNNLQAAQ